MKSKQIIILLSLIALGILGYFFLIKDNTASFTALTSPESNITLSPTLTPTPTPVVFKFDSSTDLKSELEFVNPKVETSDFDKLKQMISTL